MMNDIQQQIYATYKKDAPRPHLGASVVGMACSRAMVYHWRHAADSNFDGRMLRLFKTGHLSEDRIIAELREAGYEVKDRDENGKQYRFHDLKGHFAGSCDGMIKVGDEWHLLEVKTHSQKSFDDLIKKGVKESKPQHVVQMLVYMHYFKLDKAVYIAENKNTSELYTEIVQSNEQGVLKLIESIKTFIIDNESGLPDRISENTTWYQCKMCDYYDICQGDTFPNAGCRTCGFVTVADQGNWHCEKHKSNVPFEYQSQGCKNHIYIPPLISKWKPVEMKDDTVTYSNDKGETLVNGKNGMASSELAGRSYANIGVPF
jgi:hypothetical protein